VEMLGHKGKLNFTQSADALVVSLPTEKPCECAWSFKITGSGLAPARGK
jgi:hypothetical protein